MIWTIALVICIFIAMAYFTLEMIRWNKQINYIADVIMPLQFKKKANQSKWLPYSETREKEYTCPNCGQSCSKEEFEHGFCLDCDQIELFDDFEGGE